jgi:hypothetical protein
MLLTENLLNANIFEFVVLKFDDLNPNLYELFSSMNGFVSGILPSIIDSL